MFEVAGAETVRRNQSLESQKNEQPTDTMSKNKMQLTIFLGFFGLGICLMALVNMFFPGLLAGQSSAGRTTWFNTALLALGSTIGVMAWWLRSKQN